MITALDDYNIHQTPEPLAQPASSDRNVYDRYFFAGYAADGRYVFEAALGLYPNRRVLDCHFSVLIDGVQTSFHGSRRAPLERGEMVVGPFILEIDQPMRRLRLRLAAGGGHESGLSCDLRFEARSAPGEEPRSLWHDEGRVTMHSTRFTQFGRWQGQFSVEGQTTEVNDAMGVRDKSWGIRPCGEPEGGVPSAASRSPAVYWAWAPLNFAHCCTQFNAFEDPNGRQMQWAASITPAYARPEDIPGNGPEQQTEMRSAALSVQWQPGTRHPNGGRLVLTDPEGHERVITLTPLATFMTKGLGYHHREWGHGFWKGELALGHERWRVAELDPLTHDNVHVHQLVRARMQGPEGESEGLGILETMCFGPHAPSGFKNFLDPAL